MLVIDHSYLIPAVELPSIKDTSFKDYNDRISSEAETTVTGRTLDEGEFEKTLINYNEYKKKIKDSYSYQQIDQLLSDFTNETVTLKKIMSIKGCGKSLEDTIKKYIQTRHQDHQKKQLEKSSSSTQPEIAESSSIAQLKKDEITPDPKEDKFDEEIKYLETLIPMSNDSGRIKSLLFNTVYGNNQNQNNESPDSLRSVWLFLLKKLDPMFGESYTSYAIRMIQQEKMPLHIEHIPKFYGNGKLHLYKEFDVWPELHSVFVMYYLFHCPFESSELSPIPTTREKPVEAT